MDDLNRILNYIGELQEFQFFIGCSLMKINHLCFANDLLLFCKGEAKSTYLMLQGLKLFTESTGLQDNKTKSALYSSTTKEDEIVRISQFSGFVREQLPFRYLGVPISSTKIKAAIVMLLWRKWFRELGFGAQGVCPMLAEHN